MITGKAKLAGVVGWPVGHSRSPLIHNHWLARYGLDGAYVPLPVSPGDFEASVAALRGMGFRGVNVTVPHKEAAHRLATSLDEAAAEAGAVNTLIFHGDGRVEGRNTDGLGFLASLDEQAAGWIADRPACVMGAGGGARAVVSSLLRRGVPLVRLANRTRQRAERLAAVFPGRVEVMAWREDRLDSPDAGLLVNTTTRGLNGRDPLVLDIGGLPADCVVADIVYTPLETALLSAARARGLRSVDGLGMLLHQARPGFAAWFGIEPAVDADLRRHVLAGLL